MWRYRVLVGVGLLLMIGCATNTDVERLEGRLDNLHSSHETMKKEIKELNARLEKRQRHGERMQELYAEQDAKFYELKSDVRKLSGRFEETEHRLTGGLKELSGAVDANREKLNGIHDSVELNDERISRLTGYLGFDSEEKLKAAVGSPSDDENASKKLPEDKLYSFAKKSFDQKNYETARDAFEKFLETYPESDKADNARFWIGEIYFNEKWYEKAIVEYEEVIKQYPEGNKVRAAYLKQGIAFQKLGETGNARLIFKDLTQKYPDSSEAAIAKKKLDKLE